MPDTKFVTLAIHTVEKAQILKSVLEGARIEVQIEDVDMENHGVSSGVRVRIRESDLPRALSLVENRHLFSYSSPETIRSDDGRKRILVPVDFSDYSLKACYAAFALAKEINAKVKIMHVYYNPYYPTALPMAEAFSYQGKESESFRQIIEKVRTEIQDLCCVIDRKIAKGDLPPVNYSYVLKEGLPEEEIVNFAKEYNPAIIIMGTRGVSQKDADLIGSVTAEVIEMTRIPVFTVPENTHLKKLSDIRHIAFLTNFSQRDLISFDFMMDFFKDYGVGVSFTHIARKGEDPWDEIKLAGIKAYFAKQYPQLEADYKVIEGDMLQGVDRFIRDCKIDLLALTTAKRNIFARMFNPSISRRMLFHTDTPLLVLRG